jgi:hypothetical protein
VELNGRRKTAAKLKAKRLMAIMAPIVFVVT